MTPKQMSRLEQMDASEGAFWIDWQHAYVACLRLLFGCMLEVHVVCVYDLKFTECQENSQSQAGIYYMHLNAFNSF